MFTFLGTGAGEQYPGIWCACPNCRQARQLGGRNIRRNSSAVLGNHTLLDGGPSLPLLLQEQGLSPLTIETIVVTHSHEDHFFPFYLRWRFFPAAESPHPKVGPTCTKPLPLTIYGNKKVAELAFRAVKEDLKAHHLEIAVLKPWEKVTAKHLSLIPIKANHDFRQDCFNYILEYKKKTILYAVDTAWFLPETREFLKGFRFDLVVMEGTLGFYKQDDDISPGHSDFYTNKRAREWMLEENLIQTGTLFAITHTGPHQAPPHEKCAPLLEKWGLTLAYDGLRIDLGQETPAVFR